MAEKVYYVDRGIVVCGIWEYFGIKTAIHYLVVSSVGDENY